MPKARARKLSPAQQFSKDYTALKHYLIGHGYTIALRALGLAERHHTGKRKDKKTPELHHQVNICFTIIGLRNVLDEETCLAVALLHDTMEDYNVPYDEVEKLCGERVAKACRLLDKNQSSLSDLVIDPVASLVKGADNADNTLSMHGVFSLEKMQSYIKRTQAEILPMLKQAAKLWPEQHLAYASLRTLLKKQIKLNEVAIDVVREHEAAGKVASLRRQLLDQETFAKQLQKDLDAARTEANEWKNNKVGEKTRRLLILGELYRAATMVPRSGGMLTQAERDEVKRTLELLTKRWDIEPSYLAAIDDSKVDRPIGEPS